MLTVLFKVIRSLTAINELASFALSTHVSVLIPLSAFFLANEYLRIQGLPGFVDARNGLLSEFQLYAIADNFIAVAKGELDAKDLDDRTADVKAQNIQYFTTP